MPSVRKERPPRSKKKTAKPTLGIALPDTPNIIPQELSDSVCLIYGEKAVGKTTLAAHWENSLTLMFERGRRNLPIYQIPKEGEPELTWESTLEYIELFLKSDFQTLTLDTIDRCYINCFNDVCSSYGVKHPDDYDKGYKIWEEVATEFGALLTLIQRSDKGLVLLSHAQPRDLTKISKKSKAALNRLDAEEATVNYQRWEPTCKPACFRLAQEICDFVFYYGYYEGQRTITVRSPHNIHWCAAGVADRFLDPDGNPIQTFTIPEDSTGKAAYETLLAAYNNEVYDVDYEPPRKNTKTLSNNKPQAPKKRTAKKRPTKK